MALTAAGAEPVCQWAVCPRIDPIGLDPAGRIGSREGDPVRASLLRQQAAKLLVLFAEFGVFLLQSSVLVQQEADRIADLLDFRVRVRAVGRARGRFGIVLRQRGDQQAAE